MVLKEIESQLKTKFKKCSILYFKNTAQLLRNDVFAMVIAEMQENVPFVLDVLNLCCHRKQDNCRVAMIATIFGMTMQSRVKQLSAIQRLYSGLCIRYHADNVVNININVIIRQKLHACAHDNSFLYEYLDEKLG